MNQLESKKGESSLIASKYVHCISTKTNPSQIDAKARVLTLCFLSPGLNKPSLVDGSGSEEKYA